MIGPLGGQALKALAAETSVAVNRSRCVRHRCSSNACVKCVEVCPVDAISWTGKSLQINTNSCTQCLSCLAVCPTAALFSPEFSLLKLFSNLAKHSTPVMGCHGKPETQAHARMPCLGYLAHPEVMTLCALVFPNGLHINMTACADCPNGQIVDSIFATKERLKDLIPDHAIKLILEKKNLDFVAPAMSRRGLFSQFRKHSTDAAATMISRIQGPAKPPSYGDKHVPEIRALLIRAMKTSTTAVRLKISDHLFGKIIFTPDCNRSERCVGVCPTGAIEPTDEESGPPAFTQSLCVSCNSCQAFCPNHGVLMEKEENGLTSSNN